MKLQVIWDLSGIFFMSSLVKISMMLLISSFSLKLFLNLLVYDQNIFGSSLKVFLEIFGNLRKFSENVLQHRIFGKWSEIFAKSSSVCPYNERCSGLMASVLVPEVSGPGSNPGGRHCVVFLGKTINSHSTSLHPGV